MEIIDLSRELYHRTPSYPGHPPVIHGVWKTHEESFAESGNVHGLASMFISMVDHAGTHIDTPHHFFRDMPGIEHLPLDAMIGEAIVMDLTFKGKANERITPTDLERAERALNAEGIHITPGATIFLRTEWPKGHVTTDPKWWDESPCLTKAAAEWLVAKQPKVLGYDFAQEEKGGDYEHADEILASGMRVHRTILPRVVFQIENLVNLDQIPAKVKLIALPAKWRSESAPARVVALVE